MPYAHTHVKCASHKFHFICDTMPDLKPLSLDKFSNGPTVVNLLRKGAVPQTPETASYLALNYQSLLF